MITNSANDPARTALGSQRPSADDIFSRAKHERFQSQLLESVQESIVATDLDGRVTYWGRGAEELYGYSAAEVLGEPITFIVEPGEEEREKNRMRQVLDTGMWRGVYQQCRKDGTKFWSSTVISLVTDDQGAPAGFIGIDLDITEQRETTEELAQLKLAIENSMQGISRLDREGRFIMVKPLYSRMLGYEPEELLGESWAVTVPDDDYGTALEGYHTMLREGRATLECRALRKDGSVFVKQLLLVKTFDDQGEHNGHYCFMSDVTKRKRAEDQLHAKEAQLAHVSRLSTMGELVAGIAHEINQPLYAIANFAAVAERMLQSSEGDQSSSIEELNKQISEQAVRAGDIIRRLQAYVRKSDGVRSEFDINDAIRDAVAILAPITRSTRSSIRLELSEQLSTIHADRVQIEQVLVNLVRNALEAVADTEIREITIRSASKGKTVEISVEDTGPSLEEEDIVKLFDPFFTTKESGLGMGLAISQTIIHSHLGRIWASPGTTRGLNVSFALPLSTMQDVEITRYGDR